MMWNLPTEIKIDDETTYHITKKCDYRVVLDVICVLNDNDLTVEEKIYCSLLLFYEELTRKNIRHCSHLKLLQKEMFRIINNGEEEEQIGDNKPILMSWEHDFSILAPQINKVLKAEIRNPDAYFHWYTFLGGYFGIKPENNTWATVVSIRSKRAKGQKLEKHEIEFYRENRKMVDLPQQITAEERDLLNALW